MLLSGLCDSAHISVLVDNGKVTDVNVVYSGATEEGAVAQNVTLAQAVKAHSLQSGLAEPSFVSDGKHGVIDVANRIAYFMHDAGTPQGLVQVVTYMDDSPLLPSWRPLSASQTREILDAARQATVENVPSSLSLGAVAPQEQKAQSQSTGDNSISCPIEIVKIDPTGNDSFGHAFSNAMNGVSARRTDGTFFVLKVKNTSGKEIRGMKFQAAYYDATEDLHDIPVAWNWTDPIKVGAEKSFRWENIWREESKLGWRVRVLKVLFEDGSKWEPSPADACKGEFWRNKKHQKTSQ